MVSTTTIAIALAVALAAATTTGFRSSIELDAEPANESWEFVATERPTTDDRGTLANTTARLSVDPQSQPFTTVAVGLVAALASVASTILPAMSTAVSIAWIAGQVIVAAIPLATVLLVGGYYTALDTDERDAVIDARNTVVEYYRAMWYFLVKNGSFEHCPHFSKSLRSRVQVYSLSTIFYLWDRPHYRNGTFQEDMVKNLRDVALPGTGVPLSLVAQSKLLSYLFVLVGYPIIAFLAAVIRGRTNVGKVAAAFVECLVEPEDWFSYWRLNCRLASLHASLTGESDYELEDKWKFLTVAEERNVAVTPYMRMSGIVCKHRNEEGGLGFESFTNASVGGDWIIQRKLDNNEFLNSMLPDNAPLSTFRIISASRGGLKSDTDAADDVTMDDVQALSCVWRAGRAKAKTDHSAILFNVDPKTGVIKRGTTNVHWYQRGFSKIFTTPWTSEQNVTHHPDTGVKITGVQIPEMKKMMDFVRDAHLRLIPHVPLCGWDVAYTPDHGMLLLEGNFSCNFFRGDFDKKAYFEFVSDYFIDLERRAVAC